MISFPAFIILIGVLIFVHEAGHFLAAKWAGIWVHRFALGLGTPIKALSFTRGGTEYAVCWVPLGGYVKMASREEEATTSALEGATPGTAVPAGMYYEDRPVWKRMIVTLAGVTMNIILAFALYFGLALVQGRSVVTEMRVGAVDIAALPRGAEALRQVKVGDRITAVAGRKVTNWTDAMDLLRNAPGDDVALTVNDSLTVLLRLHQDQLEERIQAAAALGFHRPSVVGAVAPDGPAARAGILAGDTLTSINGVATTQWYPLLAAISASPGTPVTLGVSGASGARIVTVVPDSFQESKNVYIGRIGVTIPAPPIEHEALSFLGAMREGLGQTAAASRTIGRTVRGMILGRVSGRNLGGPIAIGQMAGAALEAGVDVFLGFMALISVNLAVLNLLPIPILDGGQFLFLLAEGIIRRPLSIKLRERLMYVGLVLIGLLMIFAFGNDFRRLLGW